jgi:hypothetical protein
MDDTGWSVLNDLLANDPRLVLERTRREKEGAEGEEDTEK